MVEELVPYLAAAVLGGLLATAVRLPPLVGFLAAGFALHALGYEQQPAITLVGDLGVTLLLFTIGLKLRVRTLARPEVWGAATLHMAASSTLLLGIMALVSPLGLDLFEGAGLRTFALLGFALSFSSTVIAVKTLESQSDTSSLYGRIAIGVLVMQDVVAVVFLTVSSGEAPSPLALVLVLLLPAAPLLRRGLDLVGHGEMLVLTGVTLAVGLGYALFESVGLKGDLGALAIGMLLAPADGAHALSRALFNVKELLLVGFFLSIGLAALPSTEGLLVAIALVLLLPLKTLLFLLVFSRFRLRSRTTTLASLTLTNYSEFGLIVATVATASGWLPLDWLVTLAVTVALSFLVSAPLASAAERLYGRLRPLLSRLEHPVPREDDQPIDIHGAEAVVLGVGRVGHAVYDRLTDEHGLRVLGVDNDPGRVRELSKDNYAVVEGDASDVDFWDRLSNDHHVRLVVLAMTEHSGNVFALEQLQSREFAGRIVAVSRYRDEDDPLRALGADAVFGLHDEAGRGLADDAAEMLAAGSDEGADVTTP